MPNIGIPNTFGPDVQAQMNWLDANFAAGLVTFASIATGAQGGSATNSLRSNTLTSINQVYVEGFYSSTDGGGGVFVINPADTSTVDNGGTIVVDAIGNRWYRQGVNGSVSISWFGAIPNTEADQTASIQAAVATGVNVNIPSGVFTTNGPIILATPNQTVSGPGIIRTPTVWLTTTNATAQFGTRAQLFWLTSAASNAVFSNIRIDGSLTTAISGTATEQPGFISTMGSYTSVLDSTLSFLPLMENPQSGQHIIFAAAGGLASGNTFIGGANGVLGSSSWGGGAIYTQGNETTITGNQFFNFNDTVCTLQTLSSAISYGLVVTGNVFDGGTYGAASTLGALEISSGSYGVVFSGNYVRSIGDQIFINSFVSNAVSIGLTVTGNVFDLSNGANNAFNDSNIDQEKGIQLYGVTIADNQFINLTGAGNAYLTIGGNGYDIHDNIFNVGDGGVGVLIAKISGGGVLVDGRINNNHFLLNDISDVTYGIRILHPTSIARWSFIDNTFIGLGNQTNIGISAEGSEFEAELRRNAAYSQTGSANFGNLYGTTPWGTFAYNQLIREHVLNNNDTFGGLSIIPSTVSPTSGVWSAGDIAPNLTPTVTGSSGSQYVIDHWRCTITGNPGTWVQARTFTGT